MTPPLPWYLSLVDGKIRMYKNGKLMRQEKGENTGKEYGCVTSVEVVRNRDKDLLRFKFTAGKPRGFSLSSFVFTGSAFSRFFHLKGVRNPSDFVSTWEKFVKPSLDSTTGAMSSTLSADDSTDQPQTPHPPDQSTTTRSPDETPRSTRKRPLTEKTPNIRPAKVLKRAASGSSTSSEPTKAEDVDLEEAIAKCFIGYYTLPVSCLIEPQPTRLLRPVDDLFIESLKSAMKANPSMDAAPIVGLVVLDEGETFDESKKEMYHYETLGGNNSRAALQALCDEENSHTAFRTRLVSVYGGLKDDEALRLAAKHNKTTSFYHEMSTWDKVNLCRSALYSMTRTPSDAPTPTTKPQGWKSHCSVLLMSEVRKLDDACIFFLASLPKDAFQTVERVFDQYSKGNLKGQQVKKGSLGMRLDLKGNNFKPLRGLDLQVAHELLKDVADREMTIQEMMAECKDVKSMKEIQTAFLRETGVASWEEAEEKFPGFVTPEALDEYRTCNFKSGSTPPRFKDFCQLALKSTINPPTTLCEEGRFTVENCTAIVTHGNSITYASASEMCRNNDLDFTGATFTIINATSLEGEVISVLKMYVRSIKAINTTVGKTNYTVAVVCSPYIISDVKASLMDSGATEVELGFVHLKDSKKASSGPALFDATMAVIIGQCGRVVQRSPRRTNAFSSAMAMVKDDCGDKLGEDFDKAIYRDLIELYTSPADWVVNIQLATGMDYEILTQTIFMRSGISDPECLRIDPGMDYEILTQTIFMRSGISDPECLRNDPGQPPMGALLARRNSINYAAETTMHQLVKRDMNIFCSQELTDTQN